MGDELEIPSWWDALDKDKTYLLLLNEAAGSNVTGVSLVGRDAEFLIVRNKETGATGVVRFASIVAFLEVSSTPDTVPDDFFIVDEPVAEEAPTEE